MFIRQSELSWGKMTVTYPSLHCYLLQSSLTPFLLKDNSFWHFLKIPKRSLWGKKKVFFKSHIGLDFFHMRIGRGRKKLVWKCYVALPFKDFGSHSFLPFPCRLMQCLGSFRVPWGPLRSESPGSFSQHGSFSVWFWICPQCDRANVCHHGCSD